MNIDKFIKDVKSIENEPNKFMVFCRGDDITTAMISGGSRMLISKDAVCNLYSDVYCLNANDVIIFFDNYKIINTAVKA